MHRTGYLNKKPIWAGIINTLDNVIEEAVPYRKALLHGFNHSEYFEHPDKLLSPEYKMFFITKDNNNNTAVSQDWHNEAPLTKQELKSILEQVELDPNDYYSSTDDVLGYGLDRSNDAERAIFETLKDEYDWYDENIPSNRTPYDYKYNTIPSSIIEGIKETH